MPQIFRIGSYIVYFWSNESDPLEPVHVHIAEGRASANATKVWITKSGCGMPSLGKSVIFAENGFKQNHSPKEKHLHFPKTYVMIPSLTVRRK